ncbi:glycosyltransferase family 9 protein [Fusobacterium varium]|uniref:glycosyltransferase family 9 protein n=1 Tax=Fusobacterium varium TaxID=856 RepID=UPI00242F17F2|nr:glycosyltransferase family 9 protein [Fusobacterium varium]MCF0171388.1 glycosyltransferase family 9 protein [Fusobacterium varium]MCF0188811.1 glycosyltransferase family 9 protein [Bacteroidaceae bacterium]
MEILKNLMKYVVIYLDCILDIVLKKSNNLINKDLILIRVDGIGDFILWMRSAEIIRKEYKGKIILVCNKSSYSLAKELNYFDEIIPIDTKRFNYNIFYKYKILKNLRKNKYKLLINSTYSKNITSESLVKHIISQEKIGNHGDCSNLTKFQKEMYEGSYTKLIKTDLENKMELYKNLDFINELFNKNYKLTLPILKVQKKARVIKEDYCIFFMGASNLKRCWEIKKYVEIAEVLNLKIVLCGGKTEEKLGERFLKLVNNKEKIVNLIGKTSLIDIVNLIKKSKFILSNESFSIHLAALLRVKSICILGGGHFGRFLPYPKELENENDKFLPEVIYKKMECFNCNWKCKYDDIPWKCIKNIQEKDIIKLILFYVKEN